MLGHVRLSPQLGLQHPHDISRQRKLLLALAVVLGEGDNHRAQDAGHEEAHSDNTQLAGRVLGHQQPLSTVVHTPSSSIGHLPLQGFLGDVSKVECCPSYVPIWPFCPCRPIPRPRVITSIHTITDTMRYGCVLVTVCLLVHWAEFKIDRESTAALVLQLHRQGPLQPLHRQSNYINS
ncbi:hypothetical protein [Silvimonas sp.]|uniref:hypothetical protein n=1 Tax=Silvimonas sp. TaxID=2650811 RepID=UPI00284F04EF|nr:hypothetical protein [Silvimonas sp.]MDR3430286.1 hypothetical protein [Silvimonas sp.]